MERDAAQQFEIQRPSLEDVGGLIEMHVKSWIDAYPNDSEGVSEEFIRDYVKNFSSLEGQAKRTTYVEESFTNPDYYLRVAKDRTGQIIGFSDARKEDDDYELCGLYIDSSMYGSGLALAMANSALDWLGRENDIHLMVVSYNVRAQKFYNKCGFEVIAGSEEMFEGTPIKLVKMTRKANKKMKEAA